MSQLDKEMADILEACLNNPDYLNGTNWMCQMVMEYFRDRGLLKSETFHLIKEQIYGSIGESLFLMVHLLDNNKIPRETRFQTPAYRRAARDHWEALIQQLRSQP